MTDDEDDYRTRLALAVALLVLTAAVLLLTYGNHVGELASVH